MLSSTPLVTIMIPVYNRENLIREALDCALNQNFENYEVVVVDNKSTDKTYNVLKEYAGKYEKLRIFQNETNLGPVRNWKRGIEEARGKYLKILWSDDKISKDFLKNTVPILEKNNDIGFVYTTTKIYNEDVESITYRYDKTGRYNSFDFIKAHLLGGKSVPLSPGNALFRLEDVKKNLLIDIDNPKKLDFPRYGAGNDLLIFLLTADTYKYFYFIDEVLSFFRAHKGSFSVSNSLEEYYLYSKIYFLKIVNAKKYDELKNNFYTGIKFKVNFNYMIENERFKINYFYLANKIIKKVYRGVNKIVKK